MNENKPKSKQETITSLLFEEVCSVYNLSRHIYKIAILQHHNCVKKEIPKKNTVNVYTVYATPETHFADKLFELPYKIWLGYTGHSEYDSDAAAMHERIKNQLTPFKTDPRRHASFVVIHDLCDDIVRCSDGIDPLKEILSACDKYVVKYIMDKETVNAKFVSAGKEIPFKEDSAELRKYIFSWLRKMSKYVQTEKGKKRIEIYRKSYNALTKKQKAAEQEKAALRNKVAGRFDDYKKSGSLMEGESPFGSDTGAEEVLY